MAPTKTEGKVRFRDESEIESTVERQLKRKYGRGVFVESYTRTSNNEIFIKLGNSAPKDVSDRRDHDRVLKFIEYESIYTLDAAPADNGYVIDLPERHDVYEGFQEQKRKLARRLDRSMAQTIYQKLVNFPSVKNQLGAIQSILRTVWEEGPIKIETLHQVRGTTPNEREKTENYLQLLEDTGFIRIENGEVRSGSELDSFDLNEVTSDQFNEVVLGQVVNKAYSTLKDELNITLLAHYPKYANAYYFTALEREKEDVRLDAEAARDNLETLYGDEEHEIKVRQKLDDLANVDVVEKDGDGFYMSNRDIFDNLSQSAIV